MRRTGRRAGFARRPVALTVNETRSREQARRYAEEAERQKAQMREMMNNPNVCRGMEAVRG